jgi:predicted AlkP superfamily pyrophosphatase or phosphodiesterase
LRVLIALAIAVSPARAGATDSSPAAKRTAPTFEHVVLISVDGLRSDALIVTPGDLPSFARLRSGASTLNARTDPDFTITLPNHTAMLTGRFVLGEDGHGWVKNDDAASDETLHKNRGGYVSSALDVAHDNGLSTLLVCGKTKFALYDASWNADNGAPDTVGTDEGQDKLDEFVCASKTEQIADKVIAHLAAGAARSFVFAHFATTDLTAHMHGWDLTPGSRYMRAVARVDQELGRILAAIDASPALRGKTAIVLTADHGGGAPYLSHDQAHMWVDYVIPFVVWLGADGESRDLYALSEKTRKDPGLGRPMRDSPDLPPIRNGDAANVVLDLLGLPPVPGSRINAKQDLRWMP